MKATDSHQSTSGVTAVPFAGINYTDRAAGALGASHGKLAFPKRSGFAPAKTRPCWCRPCAPSLPIRGLCVFAASHPGCLVGRPRPAPRSCRLPAWLAARALVPPRLLRGPRPPPVSRGKAPRAAGPWVTAAPACRPLINTYVDFTEGVGFSGARFPPGEASRDLGSCRATAPVLTRSLPAAVAWDGAPCCPFRAQRPGAAGRAQDRSGWGFPPHSPGNRCSPLPADSPSPRPLAPAPRRLSPEPSSSE